MGFERADGESVTDAPPGTVLPAARPDTPTLPPAGPPAPMIPLKPPWYMRVLRAFAVVERWVVDYFTKTEPTVLWTLAPLLMLALVLYIRHPSTNFIFDEQEALLANPYVNAKQDLGFWDAFRRDFWGLPPNASIGSYRPLPNLVWRATWQISQHPFFHHLYNILIHALNGALLASFAYAVTKRRSVGWLTGFVFVTAAVLTEAVSGIVGIADVLGGLGAVTALCALRLPASAMPVGVFAAVLFGLFCKESAMVCVPLIPVAALVLAPALHPRRPARVPRALLALLAAAGAFILYVELRRQWFDAPLPAALTEELPDDASSLQLLYRDLMVWFQQAPLPKDPLNNPLAEADTLSRIAGALRIYWRGLTQVVFPATLSGDYSKPQEPVPERLDEWETLAGGAMMVLPLALALAMYVVALAREHADTERVVGGELAQAMLALERRSAMGVTAGRAGAAVLATTPLVALERKPFRRRALEASVIVLVAASAAIATEVVLLVRGDPEYVVTWPWSVALLIVGVGLVVDGWRGPETSVGSIGAWPWRHAGPWVAAVGLVWLVISYFPHSNIPVVLPTVRAERFWYFPVIGTSMLVAALLARVAEKLAGRRLLRVRLGPLAVGAFLTIQCVQAYRHSMDYRDDLAFWKATKLAVPNSAKAHLNYSVMVGARGDLETRLVESRIAIRLAKDWPMAHIYTGDALCRLHRAHEAWPHYKEGFDIGENERSLIALALQCMHDEGVLLFYEKELRALSDDHPGSWISYLADDTLENHAENKGVDPEYRPRGYNQGPKDE